MAKKSGMYSSFKASSGVVNKGHLNLSKGKTLSGDRPELIPHFRWKSIESVRQDSIRGDLGKLNEQIDGWIKHCKGNIDIIAKRALVPAFELSQKYVPVSKEVVSWK
jgi:hypothetical protein